MQAVKVQYTVKKEYVETNKRNIEQVMAELRELKNPNIKYSAFLLDDGQTFVHFAMYPDEESASIVGKLDSFKKFREQLSNSQPEVSPKADNLSLVASAYNIF